MAGLETGLGSDAVATAKPICTRSPIARGGGAPSRWIFGLLGLSAAASALASVLSSHLIWNATASLPLGLYWRSGAASAGPGELVALHIPPAVRPLVRDRRYLPDGSLLIKPVAAVAGDVVCATGGVLYINGARFGDVRARDAQGRSLPQYEGCGQVPKGQVFLASRHPRSFDSRVFGLVDTHALQGTVIPLWTY